MVDALAEAAARAVNQKIQGSLEPEETRPQPVQADEETSAVPDWAARVRVMTDEEVEALRRESEGKYTGEQLDALGRIYGFLIELAQSSQLALEVLPLALDVVALFLVLSEFLRPLTPVVG